MDINKLTTFKVPFLSKTDIDAKADNFRNVYWKNKEVPVNVEDIIEKELKLTIIPENGINDAIEGVNAYISKDFKKITVEYNQYMNDETGNRLRFSFAHELGHLVLHKDIYSEFNFNDIDEYKNLIENIPEEQYDFIEYQANEFAGRLIVPLNKLKEEISKYKEDIKEYVKAFPDKPENRDSNYLLERISSIICHVFGVPRIVIEIRINREKIDLYKII